MSFLIDNAGVWYVLFGLVGLGFGFAWWAQRRPKLLLGLAAAIGLIALLWLLTRLVMTDRKQLDLIIHEMANVAADGKADVILKHLGNDFEFQTHKRQDIAEMVVKATKRFQVTYIHISSFEVEELKENQAKVYFRATVPSRLDETPQMIACRGFFIKEDGSWKLKEARFYNPVVNQQMALPID